MVDFGGAIKKPFANSKNMLIGMILAAIPIVQLLVEGYALKNAEEVIKGKKALKLWAVGDIVEYIVKLIISWIISIIYFIIPAILIGIGLGSAFLNMIGSQATSTDPTAMLQVFMQSLAVGGPFLVIGAILGILAALALPMAYMKWLKAGKIGAALNVVDVVKSCLTADYIVTLIVAIIYSFVLVMILGLIAGVLLLVPFIGFILSALVFGLAMFAVQVSVMSMFAETVK